MCIQLLALDEALGEFFRALDGTNIDYVVMLTADHGGHDIPSATGRMPRRKLSGWTRRSILRTWQSRFASGFG
jgi:predicted AlkP superfamily pyrophosphatase or phosphodiesterase